ncbi:PDDEXK nuclease domain-containing protein [Methanobrevibacter curvatus]|uniref:Endonuclease NucS n=1 Tax=Methanobrevibacter curvatus TaxID=49547 RepID=A0A166AVV6_9EURY|nr:PDDEXK nuclease domain-containing protein [Methanobrevibacter curvatus]KZX12533.1 hypothetical protein MBCUR_10230 [Methanobrevibacter curvatus]
MGDIEEIYKKDFLEVLNMIRKSQYNALKTINSELISLYWNIGKYIDEKIKKSDWGESVVKHLAEYIFKKEPNLKGFSNRNLWRMNQFYLVYKNYPKLKILVREISWTNNLLIFSRCESIEEKIFYINSCRNEKWSKRELDRQISSSLFERTMLYGTQKSKKTEEIYPNSNKFFKDSYVFEFLDLKHEFNENDLQNQLINNLKNFILEIGKDFAFVGENYRLQVGNSDFFIDLLFFHRDLQCLVAFELKMDKFKPEYIGQLNFYLEALDKDVKKTNENPSIGVLLCSDKDDTVVEYSLNRSLSPAMVSKYQTIMPEKKLLQDKYNELLNG